MCRSCAVKARRSPAQYLLLRLTWRETSVLRAQEVVKMKSRRDVLALCPVTKAGDIPVAWVYPLTAFAPTPLQNLSEPRKERSENLAAHKTRGGFAPREARHSFAIETLPKPGGFRSHPYLYTCVRCKWSFRVNDRPGSIITLDDAGHPLPEPECTRRAVTFAGGPCPAFGPIVGGRATELQSRGWLARGRYRLARRLEMLWRRWSGEEPGRIPTDPSATTMIMAEDLLR
jgi:hypothetical protein